MLRAICLIRTSTIAQEVESQKDEIVAYTKAFGYNEDEIVIIGGAGASAIKLDEQYKENLAAVYETIANNNIECVFAWAIDRIGRDEVTLFTLKNYLIENKVNLIIKNPTLKLLNEDGTVNQGVEIAMSLYITMAKQEMQQKKARFERAKKRNKEQGKFNGGTVKFGYGLDENNRYIPHAENSKIVVTIFTLYATNLYSTSTLFTELKERGIVLANKSRLRQILVDKTYIGQGTNKTEPLISVELFNKVQQLLQDNKLNKSKESAKRYCFGVKLLKCKECGTNFIQQGHSYRCYGRQTDKNKCSNTVSPNTKVVDGVLWAIGFREYLDALTSNREDRIRELNQQIEDLNDKLANYAKTEEKIRVKLDRLQDLYIELAITKEQFITRKEKITQEAQSEINRYKELQEQHHKLQEELVTLNSGDEDKAVQTILDAIDNEQKLDGVQMHAIVHKHILNMFIYPTNEDKHIYNIEVTTTKGYTYNLLYKPYFRGHKIYYKDNNKPFEYDEVVRDKDNKITLVNPTPLQYLLKKREQLKKK